MKKLVSLISLATALLMIFTACAASQKEPVSADIMKSIRGSVDLPDMAEIAKDKINGYYDIDQDKIAEIEYIIAGSGVTADEIMVIKMNDAKDVESVVSEMKARKEQIADLFSTYNPDEVTKINTCVIESKGKYAFFAICNDNQKAKDIFDASFK